MKPFLFLLLCSITFISFSQSEKEKVENTVSQEQLKAHIYFLSDDLLKGRETGTPENKIAASYLANTLRSYGVQPNPKTGDYYQKVQLEKVSPPTLKKLFLNGNTLSNMVIMDAQPINYNEEALFVGYGMEADYEGKNVKGKVVLLKAGNEASKDTQGAFRLLEKKRK